MDYRNQHWVSFALITLCSFCDISARHVLSIQPLEVEVLVHRSFHLYCASLTNSSSDDLRLKFVFRNGSEVDISERYITKVNESTVELNHPGLSGEYDGCNISCSTATGSVQTTVNVKETHPIPRITHYEFWNWEELRFSWQFDHTNRSLETKFRGWYKDSSATDFTECPSGSVPNECIVKKKMLEIAPTAGIAHIKVNGTNKLENISIDGILFPLSKHIRPGKVKFLNVRRVYENFSICYACFRAPQKESITYNISTTCNKEQFHVSKEETPEDFSQIMSEIIVPLVGLPADSNCTVSVNAKPSQGGYWGPMATYAFRTYESVPVAAPTICRNCFDLHGSEENLRHAVIYFKPLSRDLARGNVTAYKVQWLDSHRRWTELLDSSSFAFKLQGLVPQEEYRLTVEARTAVGFNKTLELPVVVIRNGASINFRIEKFVVIAKNLNTIMTTWDLLENASSYTVFWCKALNKNHICDDVLNWMELTANCSSYEISLVPDLDHSKCIFGIGSTLNGFSLGIQWSEFVYDAYAIADPPAIELNSSTTSEIRMHIKQPPALPRGSGFILRYVIYFCPIAEENNHHCTGKLRQVSTDGWATEVHLIDLLPQQTYLVHAESWTSAGRSKHNTTEIVTTSASGQIGAGFLVLIAVGAVICLLLVIVGLFSIFRFYRRSIARYKQWLTVDVTTPPGKATDDLNNSKVEEKASEGGYTSATKVESTSIAMKQFEEKMEDNEQMKIYDEQIHVDILPVRHQSNHNDVPLYTEERLLPLIGCYSGHGSSPSVMLHADKPVKSPERQRILPTIHGKPAYIRPLMQSDNIPPEAIPMIPPSSESGVTMTTDRITADSEIDSMSYAYGRQHFTPDKFPFNDVAPVKILELQEDFSEFGCDGSKVHKDEEEEQEIEEEEEKLDVSTIDVGECCKTERMAGSFEHLPPVLDKIC